MVMTVVQPTVPQRELKKRHFSLSGGSLLLALGLAAWEVYFFWGTEEHLIGLLEQYLGISSPLGIFTPDRLGFNMAWLIFFYLAYQLISIHFAVTHQEHQTVGVLDGLASVIPLLVAAIAIFDHAEVLKTFDRWEATVLLVLLSLADLIGGFAITIALSRRMIGFGGP
jgi:hypothetical protein